MIGSLIGFVFSDPSCQSWGNADQANGPCVSQPFIVAEHQRLQGSDMGHSEGPSHCNPHAANRAIGSSPAQSCTSATATASDITSAMNRWWSGSEASDTASGTARDTTSATGGGMYRLIHLPPVITIIHTLVSPGQLRHKLRSLMA